ncbi:MAG: LD-carboxypeptidase [Mangrovibacterium sp.]
MLKPDFLKAGDRIRIVSPAGFISEEKVLPAVDLLRKQGFEVIPGDYIFNRHFQFSGTDEQRLSDLQQAFDDQQCKVVICSRGGYGTIRIAGRIDFSKFHRYPKWLVGFSDITILHACLQKEGYCSIHGPMPAYYLKEGQPNQNFLELMNLLKGQGTPNFLSFHELNRIGNATGELTGGNLSLFYSLMGTPLEPDTNGKILFIEDVSEYLYSVDRMMHSLKLAGKLKNLKGLVVGGFTELKDHDSPFGQTAEEIIMNVVSEYAYPVCFGMPSGHDDVNLPVMLGANYSLEIDESQVLFRMIS